VHAWYGTSAWADATGTRRRLQALSAAGWSTSQLGELLGVTSSAIAQLRSTTQPRVLTSTAATVATLYDAHWWRTPPGRYQTRCEHHAAQQGWVGPWRWDGLDIDDPAATAPPEPADQIDPVAIDALLTGRPVPLTRAERHTAVTELHRHYLTGMLTKTRLAATSSPAHNCRAAGRRPRPRPGSPTQVCIGQRR
jgi:hypothetical protein